MKQLKIGIFGTGRGCDIAENFRLLGCEITALCDFNENRLKAAAARLGGGIAQYTDFDSFIEHDMDAVVLANYFHEHAPYAIRCFEAGIHVFSECISNGTMAEGVALVRAFEQHPGCVYMLAENYPQMIFNREMKRIVEGGTLGKILYAEGEYNHPGSALDAGFLKVYNYFPGHWRNYLPRTYYITHSLGPIMAATGATPKRVTAFSVFAPVEKDQPTARQCGDRTAVVTMQCDDGSVFRVTGCAAYGAHHNAYRICGTRGQIENLRGMGAKIMLRYNGWEIPEGMEEINCYEPGWHDRDEELIKTSGHGGGDYLTARIFLDAIREGVQPPHPFDIYAATVMSSAAILGHRSMLEGGTPYDIPDFREETWRKKYEDDRLSPFPGADGSAPTLPCCSVPDHAPTEEQLRGYLDLLNS
ncbi:MAG: Gfo/Idh/MocA family oxidoreductase [Ruminococcaceae bacterium]|nr:Gfo/Idh/MocA family oxidoreductase [Oscillospiraceae bacterium]